MKKIKINGNEHTIDDAAYNHIMQLRAALVKIRTRFDMLSYAVTNGDVGALLADEPIKDPPHELDGGFIRILEDHVHCFSKSMDQPHPRRCVEAGCNYVEEGNP
jgi:hypothetical protein